MATLSQVAEERLVLDTAAQDLDFASERRVEAAPESRNLPSAPRNLPEVPPTNSRQENYPLNLKI